MVVAAPTTSQPSKLQQPIKTTRTPMQQLRHHPQTNHSRNQNQNQPQDRSTLEENEHRPPASQRDAADTRHHPPNTAAAKPKPRSTISARTLHTTACLPTTNGRPKTTRTTETTPGTKLRRRSLPVETRNPRSKPQREERSGLINYTI